MLGGSARIAANMPWLCGSSAADGALGDVNPTTLRPRPENIIYSVCQQCNSQCGIKVEDQDGVVVKIDGSPYCRGRCTPGAVRDAAVRGGDRRRRPLPEGAGGDPGRLTTPTACCKVLKRAGPRGSGSWKTISFEEAVTEIVEGGKLFGIAGEDREVPGLKGSLGAHKDADARRRWPTT